MKVIYNNKESKILFKARLYEKLSTISSVLLICTFIILISLLTYYDFVNLPVERVITLIVLVIVFFIITYVFTNKDEYYSNKAKDVRRIAKERARKKTTKKATNKKIY